MGLISNGTTLLDAGALDSGVATGAMTLIKTLTASSSGTLSFVDGAASVVFDGTYKEYLFTFNNIHPQTNNVNFTFNMSVDTGSNYNVTKTSTAFETFSKEDDSDRGLQYLTDSDLAQGTGFQRLTRESGADNDQSISGSLHIFDPSSTTFVKHFMSRMQNSQSEDTSLAYGFAGYGNTTSAVDAVQFKMSSGNIDAGTIKLYGIK